MDKLELLKELNVLYVDDDKKACDSLKYILKYYFKSVFIAYNGKDALEIYNKKQCDFLIVDYDMPIMDGYEFLSKVRETDNKIIAMMMSSYDDKAKLKNAIKLNLLDYLVKPYELDDLKSILKRYMNELEKRGLLKYNIDENCYYDICKKEIINGDKLHKLTSYEVKLFEYFLSNQNRVIRYEELLEMLDSDNQKSLISLIHKINKKIPIKLIENIKDIGYRLKK